MSLLLSRQHGVNPSVERCFYCLGDKGVVLFGHLKGDQQAPRKACIDMEPCDECAGHMRRGVVLISYRAGTESDPFRTGGWVVIKDEAVSKVITEKELVEDILKRRFAMVPDDAWCALGLPGIVPARAMHCANVHCENFEEEFVIPITLSKYTTNISGEVSVHCVRCKRRMRGRPVQYIPDPAQCAPDLEEKSNG